MKYPIKQFSLKSFPEGSVAQFFGENPSLYSKVCTPDGVCLTGGHNGWDIVAPWGTPIFAVEGGKVVEVKDTPSGYGKHVRILCGENEWTYGHLSRIDCVVGQWVNGGQQIALMGNTGFVVSGATPYWKYNPYAGTHLHLGLRKFKVWEGGTYTIQYSSGDRGTILNYSNGFMGSVDFTFDISVVDEITQKQLTIISLANQVILLLKQLISKKI